MLQLYQFPNSPFCLKIRMALKAKGLSFRTIDVTPGIGQISIFRLSGQRQLPVLVDEENIIFDSREIIKYLDKTYLDQPLIPQNIKEATQALVIEDWADTILAKATKKELLKSASVNRELLKALLPRDTPPQLKNLASQLPCGVIHELNKLINQEESAKLLESLEELSNLFKDSNWIIGNSMTVADIAIAAQLSLVKFPPSSGMQFAGKGCKGFNDNPKLSFLFKWRDQLDIALMQVNPTI